MKPIKTKTYADVKVELVEEEWTYEKIMKIWDEDSEELVPMLAKRCKELEERIDSVYALVVEGYSDSVDVGEAKDILYGEE